MEALPLFHRVRGETCVLIGAGNVARRKLELLLAAGAALKVVAPECNEEFTRLAGEGRLTLVQRRFQAGDLDGAVLAVAATPHALVNRAVFRAARARGIPVNVVDQPELCTVTFPAVVDRDPVCIAIGTGGASPVLARLLRTRLEAELPGRTGELAALAREFRAPVRERIADATARRGFWEAVLQGQVAELIYSGRPQAARRQLERQLDAASRAQTRVGEVYLVGAGPGDPDLLTFRALRLMQQADVVLYDRLVAAPILALVRRDAERIYVGKRAGMHAVPQQDINARLVEYARAGQRVLRLKGGDPFLFGRGGEEIATLAAQGIPFQVVPGVTAASGCAAYAGIPLTHRDHAQLCVFVTGHLKDGSVDLPWPQLVALGGTLVVYMGLGALAEICGALIAHGKDPATPAAVVAEGTTLRQQIVTAPLCDLATAAQGLPGPALIIVGGVVGLHETLSWFSPSVAQAVIESAAPGTDCQ